MKILAGGEYDNPDWSPDNAQKFVSDKLSQYDPSEINGVYAANDGQAGGVVAALTGAGVSADKLPPVTGQDSEIAAIQRILAGEQYMTIFKSYFIEAAKAAEVAVQLVKGEDVTGTTDYQGVKSFIFDPVVVTKDNVKTEIVVPKIANAVPHLHVRWDVQSRKIGGAEMVKKLREGTPSIEVPPGARYPLTIGVWMMQPGDDEIVGRRIREVLSGA